MTSPAEVELEELCRARVGTTLLGKWSLDQLLGLGGMGAVYAGTHRNGSRVAIKMLHPQLASDLDATRRFRREGYVANKVDHPGSVRVIDDDVTEDGVPFLVMPLLEGRGLHEVVAEREGERLAPREVLEIAAQVLSTLVSAHAAGVVHRDLKPENLFLEEGGTIRILDFGIARLRELSGTTNHTKAGTLMGTPSFMPPEQALGYWDQIDGRTDLWAVGAVMFTLLTGKLVHHAKKPCKTPNEELLAAMSKPAPPVREVDPAVPAEVAAVVDKALAFDMANRYAGAEEMKEAVASALASLGASLPAATSVKTLASAVSETAATLPLRPIVEVSNARSAPRVRSSLASGPTGAPVSSGASWQRPPKPTRKVAIAFGVVVGLAIGGWVLTSQRGDHVVEPVREPASSPGPASVPPTAGEITQGETSITPVGEVTASAPSASAPAPTASSPAPVASAPLPSQPPSAVKPPVAGVKPPPKPTPPSSSASNPWSKWE